MHVKLGESLAIKYKKTTTSKLSFLRCWEQKQGAVKIITQRTTKRWTDHLSHDSCPSHRYTLVVIPFKDPSVSFYEVGKGTCFLLSLPWAAARAPIKPCLISMTVREGEGGMNWESNTETYTLLSHSAAQSCQTPWTIVHQAPLSMGFSKQEYWSALPFPSPGDFPRSWTHITCVSCIVKRILYHYAT